MPSRGEHSRFLGGVLAHTLEAGLRPAQHSPRPRRDVRSSVAKPPGHRSPSNPDGRKGISTQVPYMPADNNPTRPPGGRLAPQPSANLEKILSEISRILKTKPAARCSLTASGSAARQYWSPVSASRKASAPYPPNSNRDSSNRRLACAGQTVLFVQITLPPCLPRQHSTGLTPHPHISHPHPSGSLRPQCPPGTRSRPPGQTNESGSRLKALPAQVRSLQGSRLPGAVLTHGTK